ncbi:MarR family winged helix-turn-helix transcriptional regulator [Chryseobacterium sp. PTM-20240506]|uniref:MarR family winged helix-turn-helix transcriptional regulator n=1 Tax=unclassified Chryseobacterium TaxID=2593645 RepID=UPI00235966CF|nr:MULTISPECIES: MarR family transcriptional regulator [unclassified Chryseobacterium]MDC8103483.1 MarR family transcriptional regulator [Chryseobacterium sp. B21-037]MDQ1803036.1 MarR family transcriptional regulator [Chryseobacterium sp. CKR4-1]
MNNDFIKELGYKALDSRFKRISEKMAYSVKKLYKDLDYDIEPNWYLIFMILRDKGELSLIDIAESLGYSHPSVVVTVKKMAAKDYLDVKKDDSDKRKQIVSLSPKALRLMPEFEMLWNSCEAAILKVLQEDLTILKYLDTIEASLEETSFYYRFKQEYKNQLK